MGVLPDWQIERDVKIEPFAEGPAGRASSPTASPATATTCAWAGTSRCSPTPAAPSSIRRTSTRRSFVDIEGDSCLIPPNSFALAETVEYLEIPRDIIGVCVGKITYARCGIIVNVTPLEPEWRGRVTIEISNTTPCRRRSTPAKGSRRSSSCGARQSASTSYARQEGQVPGPEGPDPAVRHSAPSPIVDAP